MVLLGKDLPGKGLMGARGFYFIFSLDKAIFFIVLEQAVTIFVFTESVRYP